MRYMGLWRPGKHANNSERTMAEMGKLIEDWTKAGKLIATGGWPPDIKCATLRNTAKGDITVTDGPYAESKELIGGFALLEADSFEEAVALTRRFVEVAGEGVCEVRPLGWQPPK
jgi:hypothetical protein